MPADRQPAMRAVDLGSEEVDRNHADESHGEHGEREAPHPARREQRHGEHDQHADGGEEQVALDEVVGRQALADGDGGAGGERQDEPRADQREDGADEHVVDGEPPVGHTASIGARQPHACPRVIGGDFAAPIAPLTRRSAPTSPQWGEVVTQGPHPYHLSPLGRGREPSVKLGSRVRGRSQRCSVWGR